MEMVSDSEMEGATLILSDSVRKTIQSIKEIVGNHSEADIYVVLKETDMDPNETTQKLLTQDPFREVKRKRDKKKENTEYRGSVETERHTEQTRQGPNPQTSWVRDNTPRRSFIRNISRGVTQEFRVVRDNRATQSYNGEIKAASFRHAISANEQAIANVSLNGTPGILTDQKDSDARKSAHQLPSQGPTTSHDYGPGHGKNADPNARRRLEKTSSNAPTSILQVHGQKLHNSRPDTATSSNSSVGGLYSSSMDPVHVPSPDSRSSGAVGAIKREVGVVGVRRQSSKESVAHSSVLKSSSSTFLGKGICASTESFGLSPALSKSDQLSQTSLSQPVMSNISVGRSFSGSQYNAKLHQQSLSQQKVSQPNMEWKPKSSQNPILTSPGSIGTCVTPISSLASNSTILIEEADHFPEEFSQINISEDQHVIIPQHLRVPEANRLQLTFGSFEAGFDSGKGFLSGLPAIETGEEPKVETAVSILLSVPVCSSEDVSGGEEDQGRATTDSPASDVGSGHPLADKNEPSSPQNVDCYRNVGLVQSHSSSFSPEERLQQQDPPSSLSTIPAFDPQTTYDEPFFRSAMDENVQGQGLALPQEALSLQVVNGTSPSSVAMVHQQTVPQLYPPQVHISHFPNFMSYRQFLSPMYAPPIAMPNYSSNSSYPHPSSGSNYLLMQGGNSHLTTGGLKYATSQYKPVPAVGPTGYGNYANPAGYTMNAPGTINNTVGIEDASRIKYKDGNLYIPKLQADTSEMWIQTPREPQSTPYYNLSGHAPHAAFLPSHTAHASFNASTQSTHVPFPGLYHPPQPTAIANPHHLVHQQLPGMGGNVGVGVASQQPQLGHLNWTTNF
ncbi:hypothetical protein AAC387_Pa02g5160 [Persea americana]